MVRLTLPQPWRELPHTADVGVEVEGASAGEALARLVLAEAALLAGGGEVIVDREVRVAAEGEGLAAVAVGILREVLFRCLTEDVVPGACAVLALDARRAEVAVGLGPRDAARHAEGQDLKAVTWHQAAFAEEAGRWRARVVFDV